MIYSHTKEAHRDALEMERYSILASPDYDIYLSMDGDSICFDDGTQSWFPVASDRGQELLKELQA